jgi:hypothetical protein
VLAVGFVSRKVFLLEEKFVGELESLRFAAFGIG